MATKNAYMAGLSSMGLTKWGADSSASRAGLKWGTGRDPFSPSAPVEKWGVPRGSYLDQNSILAARQDPYAGMFDPATQDPNNPFQPGMPGTTGAIGSPAGWESINRWDNLVLQASQQTGVPANVIKAIMRIESQGNPNALSPQGYYGLMQIGPQSAVPEYMKSRSWLSDPANQVLAGATELLNKYNYMGTGSWTDAARAYLGLGGVDAFGTDQWTYANRFNQYMAELDNASVPSPGLGGVPGGSFTSGNQVVAKAMEFVGKVPYTWGGIPGKGQNPLTSGGWDCSGFTYWLDQNYGTGALPMGSHYQYEYAQRTGQLFTNLSQLRPGDLVFINTGWQGGAGGNMNLAGHVAMYAGNGQIIHAANPSQGTIISPLSGYSNILGAMHMSWSGGNPGAFPMQAGAGMTGGSSRNPYAPSWLRTYGY